MRDVPDATDAVDAAEAVFELAGAHVVPIVLARSVLFRCDARPPFGQTLLVGHLCAPTLSADPGEQELDTEYPG